eukprot:GEMP01050936.1.p1 GENE.GEMP01050936.1~~GEMP01050936.1.p1  ORF type:complete len:291 (+),score=65.30 GEMP01050936.1:279-1151(+)
MMLCVKSGQWEPPLDKHPPANGPLPLLPQSLLIRIRKGDLCGENRGIFVTSTKCDAVDPKRRLEREVERLTHENRRLRVEVRKGLVREKMLRTRLKNREEAMLVANPRIFDIIDDNDTGTSAADLGKSRGNKEDREDEHPRDAFLRAPRSFMGLPSRSPTRSSAVNFADDQDRHRPSDWRHQQLSGYSNAARDMEDAEDYPMDRQEKIKFERHIDSREAIEDNSAYRAMDPQVLTKHDSTRPLQRPSSAGRMTRPASLDNPPSPSDTKAFFKYLDEFSAWTNELLNDEAR